MSACLTWFKITVEKGLLFLLYSFLGDMIHDDWMITVQYLQAVCVRYICVGVWQMSQLNRSRVAGESELADDWVGDIPMISLHTYTIPHQSWTFHNSDRQHWSFSLLRDLPVSLLHSVPLLIVLPKACLMLYIFVGETHNLSIKLQCVLHRSVFERHAWSPQNMRLFWGRLCYC